MQRAEKQISGMHQAGCALASVIATGDLEFRPTRAIDHGAESRAFVELAAQLARSPHDFFQQLVNSALALSSADSTGISLLDTEKGRFIWPAVAGGLRPFLGGGTPSDFGPCGTVLERNEVILFLHPEKHFLYLTPIKPALEEVLLIPFHMNGKVVGTIWAVIHQEDRKFDSEDKRVLQSLSDFAASAYQALEVAGSLQPILRKNHAHGMAQEQF